MPKISAVNGIAYRPDIDGLRAIAVGMVVIFHIFGVMKGGFIGVDIFFVISGFLITGILLREAEKSDLSIARFYERRIRRIMPALLTVLIFSSLMGLAVLLPADLIGYGKSVIAALLFVSNIYFWRDSDYFSPIAETKPLIHTWSLGVEEQFYIFFPLMIALAFRISGRKLAYWMVIVVSVLSVVLTVAFYHFGKGNVAFYILPTRIWELGAGATIAFLRAAPPTRRVATIAAALGLLLIGALVFEDDPYRIEPLPLPFPAVIGTALLIWAGRHDNKVSRLLGARLLVVVGLLSYSIYLWHWPINVYVRYWLVREPGWLEKFAILAVALLAAFASWRWVERPFRSKDVSLRRILIVTGAGVASVSIAAIAVVVLQGLPMRLPPRAARYNQVAGTNYRCPPTSLLLFSGTYACPMNLPGGNAAEAQVALLGDSFAQMYLPAVELGLRRHGKPGILVPANGCLPYTSFNTSVSCAQSFTANRQAVLKTPSIGLVIIAASWENMEKPLFFADGHAVVGNRWALAETDLGETLRVLRAANKKVALVSPIATPGYDIASVAGRNFAFGRGEITPLNVSQATFERRFGRLRRWMETGPQEAAYIDTNRYLCDALVCHFTVDDTPVFADGGHLSYLYVRKMAPAFDSVIRARR